MSRDPYRASAGDLGRGERWDRDRFTYERDRDRLGDERTVRYEEDDRVYTRDRGAPLRPPRERSVDDRFVERRFESGPHGREVEDDVVVRDRRTFYDEPRAAGGPRHPGPGPGPGSDFDRRVVIEKERERDYYRNPSPPRRPGLLRRQSSLDTFDRRPRGFHEREEYGPPARREDFRPEPYVPIPLPRTRGLPPPRREVEREYYDEIKIQEPDLYGDDEFRPYPERVREREIVRTRERDRSRESRRSHRHRHHAASTIRSTSRSSATSSSSSSSSGGTTVKSEYPKKGKTRIPRRLVSERALIDLNYAFIIEGNTVVVQKALGQENIDDLLKLSEDYKKSELEIVAARSPGTEIVEERRQEIVLSPPPPLEFPRGPPEFVERKTTVFRESSPPRHYSHGAVIVDAAPREYSEEAPVGPLALIGAERSGSRSRSELRSEIRQLERELARRERRSSDRELVKAERLSDGQLVLYEEKVERIEEPSRRGGIRIEKDKKGPPPKLVRAMMATLT